MDKQENHQISTKSLEIVEKNPMTLGVLKTLNAKDNFDFSFLELNRGMWLHTHKQTGSRMEVFLFYDLTYDQSKLIRDMFEYSKFISYESLSDSGKPYDLGCLEFIENIRNRKLDLISNTFSFSKDPQWEQIIK